MTRRLLQQPIGHRFRAVLTAAGLSAACALSLQPVVAAPLPKSDCEQLQVEQQALETMGVADDMAKGPEIVRATAVPARIEQIRRYLEVFEQLAFRCSVKVAAAKLGQTGGQVSTAEPVYGKPVTGNDIILPERKPAGNRPRQTGQLRPALDPAAERPGNQRSNVDGGELQALSAAAAPAPVPEAVKPKPRIAKAVRATKPEVPAMMRGDTNSGLPKVFQSLR